MEKMTRCHQLESDLSQHQTKCLVITKLSSVQIKQFSLPLERNTLVWHFPPRIMGPGSLLDHVSTILEKTGNNTFQQSWEIARQQSKTDCAQGQPNRSYGMTLNAIGNFLSKLSILRSQATSASYFSCSVSRFYWHVKSRGRVYVKQNRRKQYHDTVVPLVSSSPASSVLSNSPDSSWCLGGFFSEYQSWCNHL